MEIFNTLIVAPLGYIMWLCFSLVKNYGVAIILFTLVTKIIMFPMSIWVQKNSIKMIKIQPAINMIGAKFAGNRDQIAEEQVALYKQEKYKPLAGVLPMLVQIPIILALIAVVYNPLEYLLHLDTNIIQAFVAQAQELSPNMELGSTAQLTVVNMVNNPELFSQFANIVVPGADVSAALSLIRNMDLSFLGLQLSTTPSITALNAYFSIPVLSGLSAFLLCFFQNKENVLQREQGMLGKWGMTIFLTAFSTYFAFVVPVGIGIYWIFGNIFAILLIYILNWMYNPKKFIDYQALEESKIELAKSKELEKMLKPTAEQKAKAKEDYKLFFKDDLMIKDLIIYSEKSGFYKYFENMINSILENSDIVVHYVTSDPNDAIFEKHNDKLIPYYIDDSRLITLFMKIDAHVVVMTTPNLQTYHLKRSYVSKAVEYIYIAHDPLSTHMGANKGAFDHFDTVFCVGEHQVEELRETEKVYKLKEKNLIPCGYGLIDNLTAQYDKMKKTHNEKKKLLIAPSWQEGNILESCIDDLLVSLLDGNYDITLRPHPEFVKRYAMKMNTIISKYQNQCNEHFRIETDFSSNVTIFTADLVITDWSGIAFEFSYATKKPSLFINTPKKVMNAEYDKISCIPVEVSLRDQIGVSLDIDKLSTTTHVVQTLFDNRDMFSDKINEVMQHHLFHQGHSGEIAAQYVIDAVNEKKSKRTDFSI